MKKNSGVSILIGVVLAVVGIGLIGNAVFDWNFRLFIDGWWALALMVMFLALVIKDKPNVVNICGLVLSGFVFLRYHVEALQKVDVWTLLIGIALIVLAIRLFFPTEVKKADGPIETEAEVKKTEDVNEQK